MGFKERRRRSLAPVCQVWQPCPACPHPTAAQCRACVPPPQKTPLRHPSPPWPLSAISLRVLRFFCNSSPRCFSPSSPLLLSSLPLPHPCSFPPCSHDSQIRRQAARCGDERGSGTALVLLLHGCLLSPRKLPWRWLLPPLCKDVPHRGELRAPASSGCILRHGSACAGSSPRSRPTFGCSRAGNAQSRWPCCSLLPFTRL